MEGMKPEDVMIRGECCACGRIKAYDRDDDTFILFLTIPGRGAFARTIWEAELRCKNVYQCSERQKEQANQ